MKLIKNVMILVILMVILNVFTKKVNRSKAGSNLLSQLAKDAYVNTKCWMNGQSTPDKETWQYLDTNSLKNGRSGFKLLNYYAGDGYECQFMEKIRSPNNTRNSINRYFVSYRNCQIFDAANGNGYTRILQIQMRYGNFYNFHVPLGLSIFEANISAVELQGIVSNLNTNIFNYLRLFQNSKISLNYEKYVADSLTALKNKNIHSIAALKEEVTTKRAELALIKETLPDLMSKSEALKLQIRNFESETAKIKSSKLDPLTESLKVQFQDYNSIELEIKQNKDKIAGIVHINQNDLSASTTKLKSKLNALKALYLEADPRHLAIKDIIDNFATKQRTIPSVIA
jgi:hypothetical protein